MSLPQRQRSADGRQGVPAPASDAIDALVEAVSAGARPSSSATTEEISPVSQPVVTLPRGGRRSWISSRVARWIAPALLAFTIGVGGAVWSMRTFESFAPQRDSVDVAPARPAPATPAPVPSAPTPVDRLASIDLRPSAPLARALQPRSSRISGTEGRDFLALSEVEGSLGYAIEHERSPLRTANNETPSPIEARSPIEAPAPIATAPPIDASRATPILSAAEERTTVAESAATTTHAGAAEETAVLDAVEEYALALEHFDVTAAALLWPSVDRRALSRAFASLKSQEVMFENCDVALTDNTAATARCHGTTQYIAKVGPSGPRTGRYEWLFKMRKRDDSWKIEALSAWPVAAVGRDQQ